MMNDANGRENKGRICIQEPCAIWGREFLNLGKSIHIGRHTEIMADGGVTIGNNVVISYHCVLWSIDHRYEGDALPYDKARIKRPIVIHDNVWLGRNVMVRGGVTIGEGAVVAMGSVVTRDVPPLAVVGGNPARVLRFRDKKRYAKNKAEGRFLLNSGTACEACEAGDYYLLESSRVSHGIVSAVFSKMVTLMKYGYWRWSKDRSSGRQCL